MNPFDPLTPNDFPLLAVGPCVYRRMMSSQLFTAPNDWIAADLAFRLNDYEARKSGLSLFSPEPHLIQFSNFEGQNNKKPPANPEGLTGG